MTLIWPKRPARKILTLVLPVFLSCLSSGLFIAMIVSPFFFVLLMFTAGALFWIFIFGVIGITDNGRCNPPASEAVFPYCLILGKESK